MLERLAGDSRELLRPTLTRYGRLVWIEAAPGRYVKAADAPITNLFLTMADAMGTKNVDSHGDSTGRLTSIA